MSQQILREIINKGLFIELLLIILIYNIGWLISFKLGFQLLRLKVKFKEIIPVMLAMSAFSFSRQLMNPPIYMCLMISILSVLIMVVGKVNLLKSLLTALIITCISSVGDVLIIANPLFINNKSLVSFIFNTVYGNIVISIIEIVIPLIVLIVLPKFQVSLLPKITMKSDIVRIFIYGLIYLTYCLMVIYINNNVVKTAFINSIAVILVLSATIIGILVFYKTVTTYKNDINKILAENKRLEAEKNQLLARLQSSNNSKNLDFGQFGPAINEFIMKIAPIIAESYEKKPVINPNNVNLAKFGLSTRDGIIIGWIILDKTYEQISDEVHLDARYIGNVVSIMLKNLKLKNRKELARFAIENDLVEITTESS